MRDAIERSGYLLEQRVAPVFWKAGFVVEQNAPYPDPRTGISREYDIRASYYLGIAQAYPGWFSVEVICECKNNPQPVVFFQSPDTLPTDVLAEEPVRFSGLPVKFWVDGFVESASVYLGASRTHHYFTYRNVATQYCSFSLKKDGRNQTKWVAEHPAEHHGTFEALIDALEATASEHYFTLRLPNPDQPAQVNIQLYYPLLILQGDIYTASMKQRRLALRKAQHVQFRRRISRANRTDLYHIDVIQASFLKDYLALVRSEAERFGERFLARPSVVEASLRRQARDARGNGQESYRAILEPLVSRQTETPQKHLTGPVEKGEGDKPAK